MKLEIFRYIIHNMLNIFFSFVLSVVQIATIIKNSASEVGASIAEVSRHLKGVPEKAIRDAVEFLSGEGHIYSTIDDDHFKATDGWNIPVPKANVSFLCQHMLEKTCSRFMPEWTPKWMLLIFIWSYHFICARPREYFMHLFTLKSNSLFVAVEL